MKIFKGDVGIGTLIVFIAMVLVAAVAAAVLLNVSGMLQQRASATGKETTKQVSSNLMVLGVTGIKENSNISRMVLAIKASAGSGRMDLTHMLITVANATAQAKLNYTSGATTSSSFNATERIDPNNLFTVTAPVIDSSSLIDLNINTTGSNTTGSVSAMPRTPVLLTIQPETGAAVEIEFTTPEVYSGTYVQLYP